MATLTDWWYTYEPEWYREAEVGWGPTNVLIFPAPELTPELMASATLARKPRAEAPGQYEGPPEVFERTDLPHDYYTRCRDCEEPLEQPLSTGQNAARGRVRCEPCEQEHQLRAEEQRLEWERREKARKARRLKRTGRSPQGQFKKQPTKQRQTAKPSPLLRVQNGRQFLACEKCGDLWTRPATRGRPPSVCHECSGRY